MYDTPKKWGFDQHSNNKLNKYHLHCAVYMDLALNEIKWKKTFIDSLLKHYNDLKFCLDKLSLRCLFVLWNNVKGPFFHTWYALVSASQRSAGRTGNGEPNHYPPSIFSWSTTKFETFKSLNESESINNLTGFVTYAGSRKSPPPSRSTRTKLWESLWTKHVLGHIYISYGYKNYSVY